MEEFNKPSLITEYGGKVVVMVYEYGGVRFQTSAVQEQGAEGMIRVGKLFDYG